MTEAKVGVWPCVMRWVIWRKAKTLNQNRLKLSRNKPQKTLKKEGN